MKLIYIQCTGGNLQKNDRGADIGLVTVWSKSKTTKIYKNEYYCASDFSVLDPLVQLIMSLF